MFNNKIWLLLINEYKNIIKDKNKIGWKWLINNILKSSIWYLLHPIKLNKTLFYELLTIAKYENENQSKKLLLNHLKLIIINY